MSNKWTCPVCRPSRLHLSHSTFLQCIHLSQVPMVCPFFLFFYCWMRVNWTDGPHFIIHLVNNIWSISSFWLSQVKLLWIFVYKFLCEHSVQSVQSLRCLQLSATAWSAAHQVSLSINNCQNLLKHVHWVGDAVQPSHSLSSPSPSAFNLPQHQGLFQWVGSSKEAKVL